MSPFNVLRSAFMVLSSRDRVRPDHAPAAVRYCRSSLLTRAGRRANRPAGSARSPKIRHACPCESLPPRRRGARGPACPHWHKAALLSRTPLATAQATGIVTASGTPAQLNAVRPARVPGIGGPPSRYARPRRRKQALTRSPRRAARRARTLDGLPSSPPVAAACDAGRPDER